MGLPCSIRSPFLKTAAGTLSLLYFIGNVALAHSAETNFWSDRRRSAAHGNTGSLLACVPSLRLPALAGGAVLPPQIDPHLPENIRRGLPPEFLKAQDDLLRSLPYAEGSVRIISVPSPFSPEGRVVVHIQDIHRNFEAQRRIAATVAALAKHADVVGLEGSTRAIDLARVRAFPDHNAVAIAAEESLAQNEITGPIQAALTGTDPFPAVIGIDDPVHYRANIEAYRRSAPRMAEEKQKLAALITENEMAKQKTCNPALQRFDRQVKDYREGRTSLSAYLTALTEGHPRLSPEVCRFREALSMEEQLDFQAVESEHAKAVGILAARLDAGGVAQLTERGPEYRAGALR